MSVFQACYEEDEIIPAEGEMELRFEFPQGDNSWDEELAAIKEEFGVCLIYKDVDSTDLSRSWTGGGGLTMEFKGQNLNDEQAEFYTSFLKNHVFAYLNPQVTQKALPPYWYMMYNFRSVFSFGTMEIYSYQSFYNGGLDFWVICLESEFNPLDGTQLKRPETPEESLIARGWVLSSILARACNKGTIVVPEEFHVGFDYQTPISYASGYEHEADYYIKRGFPGRVTNSSFNFSPLKSIADTNPTDNFIQYMTLGIRYSKQEYEEMWPSAEYSLIHEKRQFVIDYMKSTYNIDLEAMHDGPQL